VPALAALGHAQVPVALGARRALGLHWRAAGDIDDLPLSGVGVEPLERDGPDAHAVLLGDLLDDVLGERHGQPDGARQGAVVRVRHAASPRSVNRVTIWRMSVSET